MSRYHKRRRRPKYRFHRSHKQHKKYKLSIKWSLIWIIIHSISLFLLGIILNYFNTNNSFVQLFLMGFGVSILAKIAKIFTAKKKFVVDRWFIFWSLINATTIWILSMLFNRLNISNYFLIIVLTALGLVVVAYIIRRFRITKTVLWGTVIVILILLFLLAKNTNQQNLTYSGTQNVGVNTGNIFDSIKIGMSTNDFARIVHDNNFLPNFCSESNQITAVDRELDKIENRIIAYFDKIATVRQGDHCTVKEANIIKVELYKDGEKIKEKTDDSVSKESNIKGQQKVNTGNIFDSIKNLFQGTFSKECPQINVPLSETEGMLPFMNIKEYDGWKIAPYNTNTLFGFNFGQIFCHKGSKQGQNLNYWYCGDKSSKTTMAFMQKTMINSDGTLGKTVKQSFYNVYDENKQFVKTVCGKDPDKIAKKEFSKLMDEMDDLFD